MLAEMHIDRRNSWNVGISGLGRIRNTSYLVFLNHNLNGKDFHILTLIEYKVMKINKLKIMNEHVF